MASVPKAIESQAVHLVKQPANGIQAKRGAVGADPRRQKDQPGREIKRESPGGKRLARVRAVRGRDRFGAGRSSGGGRGNRALPACGRLSHDWYLVRVDDPLPPRAGAGGRPKLAPGLWEVNPEQGAHGRLVSGVPGIGKTGLVNLIARTLAAIEEVSGLEVRLDLAREWTRSLAHTTLSGESRRTSRLHDRRGTCVPAALDPRR